MDISHMIYFLDCYLLMLDEGEELEQIVRDYINKEDPEWGRTTVEQVKKLMALQQGREMVVEQALSQCIAYNRDVQETVSLLEDSLRVIEGGERYGGERQSD